MDYKVIDNFLPSHQFQELKTLLLGDNFPWYFSPQIASTDKHKELYYFIHTFFNNHTIKSQFINVINPILEKINPVAIHRIKSNLYPNTNKYIQHGMHQDLNVPHKGALFYVNTNNGHTILEDGTKIESIENRILFFDSNKLHCSTSCTDQKTRVTLNINYF
jgi:hypothetical protein